ncbi:MAG TPA: VWA domain-containing protein [Anaerolineales bacterium]|nr:VWA domain-containing protein [Anaerolineales bacterium]
MNGRFLHNLLLFGRILRKLGLDVNPGRMMDLVSALDHIEMGYKSDFFYAARTLLVHDREDLPLFDEAFDLFWRKPAEDWEVEWQGLTRRRRRSAPVITHPPLKEAAPPSDENASASKETMTVIEVTRTYSGREILRHKDFAEMTEEESEAVKQMMSNLLWKVSERRTRRLRPGKGSQIDLRRTLRRSLRAEGEIFSWAYRERKLKPRPLVIIADISASMERYTRLLLHFIYGMNSALRQPVEAFLFSTRLTRITRPLQLRDLDLALKNVGQLVHDWAGGTRIGESLKTFNFEWGRRVLGRGAVVLIISDGWDRGDVDLLARELARLRRNCHRIIWLNPLLGARDYEPLTRGIQAAMPYIDDFLPVHNLASLEDLANRLVDLDRRSNRGSSPIPGAKKSRHEGYQPYKGGKSFSP